MAAAALAACWFPARRAARVDPLKMLRSEQRSLPPVARPGLGFGDLFGRHELGQDLEAPAADAGAGRSQGHPHVRRDQVLLHALAGHVHRSQVDLRAGVPLFGAQPVQANRLFEVLIHAAAAFAVQRCQDGLTPSVAPIDGEPGPTQRLFEVLIHAATGVVRRRQHALPQGVSPVGGEPGPAQRLLVVVRRAEPQIVGLREPRLRAGVSLLGENPVRFDRKPGRLRRRVFFGEPSRLRRRGVRLGALLPGGERLVDFPGARLLDSGPQLLVCMFRKPLWFASTTFNCH